MSHTHQQPSAQVVAFKNIWHRSFVRQGASSWIVCEGSVNQVTSSLLSSDEVCKMNDSNFTTDGGPSEENPHWQPWYSSATDWLTLFSLWHHSQGAKRKIAVKLCIISTCVDSNHYLKYWTMCFISLHPFSLTLTLRLKLRPSILPLHRQKEHFFVAPRSRSVDPVHASAALWSVSCSWHVMGVIGWWCPTRPPLTVLPSTSKEEPRAEPEAQGYTVYLWSHLGKKSAEKQTLLRVWKTSAATRPLLTLPPLFVCLGVRKVKASTPFH